jgi:sarcosine oxidase
VTRFFDAAVVGVGTMGSFACCELARRGLRVIGFDRFAPPHGMGSHSGDTRVFRVAYYEHPDYVPLALRADELWSQYEEMGNAQLLTRSGMLNIGHPEDDFMVGILKSADIHGLETIQYTPAEIRRLFPAFAPDEDQIGIFEPQAGWIDSNAAIETALRIARLHGATLLLDDPVLHWTRNGYHFEVTSASGTVIVKKLIVTGGAWGGQLLQELGLPLRVERRVLTWVDPIAPEHFQCGAFPVFAYGKDFLYGFPAIDERGVKLAVHATPGRSVPDLSDPLPKGNLEDATEPLVIAAKIFPHLAGPLPHALQRVTQMKTCLYTMSHDGHFYVDRHHEWPELIFAAGFSGHGFKFAPAIGEVLADLATIGEAKLPVGFLGLNRLAAREPKSISAHSVENNKIA